MIVFCLFYFLFQSRKFVSPEASTAALNDLIHNITRSSTENALTSSLDSNMFNCSVHGENYSVQENLTSIDLVKALCYFDVPNEIVKILRTYHAFLKTETHSLRFEDSKSAKSIDNFLNKFEAMVSNKKLRRTFEKRKFYFICHRHCICCRI